MADDGGIGRLQRRLAAIPSEVRKAVRPTLVREGEKIADTMRMLVPVDDGDLKASIGVTVGGYVPDNPNVRGVSYSPIKGSEDLSVTVHVGDETAYYAAFVEFGTAAHNAAKGGGTKKGKRSLKAGKGIAHPGGAAQPFFWPAVRLHNKKARAAIKRAIGTAVRKNWGSGS